MKKLKKGESNRRGGARRETYKVPNKPGWWARLRGAKTKWFYVEKVQEEGETKATYEVWHADTEQFISVTEYASPLTCWFGPVALPWNAEGEFPSA